MPPRLNGANFAHSTLTAGINNSTDTDIIVDSGSVFPTPPFRALIREGGLREIVEIQEVSGNTLKCLNISNRGLEETTKQAFAIGSIIENVFTAGAHQELGDYDFNGGLL